MEQLNYAQVRDMLLYVTEQIIDSKALLTEVDSQIGDGDHGIGMERGMKKAKEKLLSMESGSNVYALFQEMGKTMLMSMGGASGVIFGTMFMGGAKGKPERSSLDGAALIELLEGSLAQIKERGKAQVGDKTMVDALEQRPGRDALPGGRGGPGGHGGHQELSGQVWKGQIPDGARAGPPGRRRHLHLDHLPFYGRIRTEAVR